MQTPQSVEQRLEAIDQDLAIRQNLYEAAAKAHFLKVAEVTKDKAIAYRKADGNSTDKRESANEQHGEDGSKEQAEYEALKAVIKVLESRATIGMAILKSHGRA